MGWKFFLLVELEVMSIFQFDKSQHKNTIHNLKLYDSHLMSQIMNYWIKTRK